MFGSLGGAASYMSKKNGYPIYPLEEGRKVRAFSTFKMTVDLQGPRERNIGLSRDGSREGNTWPRVSFRLIKVTCTLKRSWLLSQAIVSRMLQLNCICHLGDLVCAILLAIFDNALIFKARHAWQRV